MKRGKIHWITQNIKVGIETENWFGTHLLWCLYPGSCRCWRCHHQSCRPELLPALRSPHSQTAAYILLLRCFSPAWNLPWDRGRWRYQRPCYTRMRWSGGWSPGSPRSCKTACTGSWYWWDTGASGGSLWSSAGAGSNRPLLPEGPYGGWRRRGPA